MNELTLFHFQGRFSNILLCLIYAIKWSLKNNYDKIICEHTKVFGNEKILNNIININSKNSEIEDSRNIKRKDCTFFWNNRHIPKLVYKEYQQILLTYIKPNINFKNILVETKIGRDDLVIHLRGGDIFCGNNDTLHHAYIQPPLSFYETIINSKTWTCIHLFSEDSRNPIFNILKEKYNCKDYLNIKGNKDQKFLHDLDILCSTTNLILSKTSLSPIILGLNTNLKHAYLSNYYLENNKCNRIWWPTDFIDIKETFKIDDMTLHISDYSEWNKKISNNFSIKNFKDSLLSN